MEVRPELGLRAMAAASFWAKSLQRVKECLYYVCITYVMQVSDPSTSFSNINIVKEMIRIKSTFDIH